MKKPATSPTPKASSPVPLFGFSVVLSVSEMMTLTRALEEKVSNAKWFAVNNLISSRAATLGQLEKSEERIAQLKAMTPQHIPPNAKTQP